MKSKAFEPEKKGSWNKTWKDPFSTSLLLCLNSLHNETKQASDVTLLPLFLTSAFHNFNQCVILWKRTVLPTSESWYLYVCVLVCDVVCKGAERIFFCYMRVSQGPWHIFIQVWFADTWPWGSLGCGCELDLNRLIPSESHRHVWHTSTCLLWDVWQQRRRCKYWRDRNSACALNKEYKEYANASLLCLITYIRVEFMSCFFHIMQNVSSWTIPWTAAS